MVKPKKKPNTHLDEYSEKVAINIGFNEALNILANDANKTVKANRGRKQISSNIINQPF